MKQKLFMLGSVFLILLMAAPIQAFKEKKAGTVSSRVGSALLVPSKADETEPNDSCGTANGPIGIGESYGGAISPADDADWYRFEASAGQCVRFQTHEVAGQDFVDTIIGLFANDCTTVLADDDDSGANYYSLLDYEFQASGTYYLAVIGYDEFETGFYTLSASTCPAPGPNDICENAIDLRVQALQVFDVDLCSYNHDYSPASDQCTGYQALGADAVYKVHLSGGERLLVTESGIHDMVLYLVTDCSAIDQTCLAGADEGLEGTSEVLDYTAVSEGWFYLIVDGYTGCGEVTVTIGSPLGVESRSWGSIKSQYR
jgi:hypothetical protein